MFDNWNFLRKLFPEKKQVMPNKTRSFVGAMPSRFVNWLYGESYSKINLDLDNGLIKLLTRTRELAKNDVIVRSYLDMNEKNVIGKTGFVLQSQLKDSNGLLKDELNDYIEWQWYEWGKLSNGWLTMDGGMRT